MTTAATSTSSAKVSATVGAEASVPKPISIDTEAAPTLQQKEERFLTAAKFAVVGASSNPTKNGAKALKWLVDHNKDVVPINPKTSVIQDIKCLKTLSELPDPMHTAVSVVVPPQVTLEILKQAKELNVFALWLQPGAEDDAVVEFIEEDAEFAQRCVYREKEIHTLPGHVMAALTLHEDTSSPCLFKEPTTASASTVVAGSKRDASSPPSTPPVTKSLKLAPDASESPIQAAPVAVAA